ncbi:MAG: M48 family metalloprotease [Gemmatimonadaceae bacterium]|nr:M48 family metalloprotease [Gemmatimonadaceae bacterium]NUR20091.1 M48 family metalloprotease [Gemmatimonadaceae bacterium]
MRRNGFAGLALAFTLAGCAISQQQEVQMGQQYAQEINAQLPLVQDAELNRYINVLGDSISKLADSRNLDWHFYIVDSPEVNAFAVPGGYIYVNRGLIERTDRMDELAGAMGHEIGHVVKRHSVKQMEKQNAASLGVNVACVLTSVCNSQAAAAAINIGGAAVFAKFSREDEAEADQEGIKNVVRAGISPEGMPSLFQKLLDERRTKPDAVSGWFASHPMEEDRIQATQATINTYDPALLRSLTKDTQLYHQFVARLKSLPPSPTQANRN